MRIVMLILVIALAGALLTACAAGPNPEKGGEDAAGFFTGLWQGFVILFTFVISLFNGDVSVYEVNNSGGWYDFGFLLGVIAFWGGGGGGAARRRG